MPPQFFLEVCPKRSGNTKTYRCVIPFRYQNLPICNSSELNTENLPIPIPICKWPLINMRANFATQTQISRGSLAAKSGAQRRQMNCPANMSKRQTNRKQIRSAQNRLKNLGPTPSLAHPLLHTASFFAVSRNWFWS